MLVCNTISVTYRLCKQPTSSPLTRFKSPFTICKCHFALLPLATESTDSECLDPILSPEVK